MNIRWINLGFAAWVGNPVLGSASARCRNAAGKGVPTDRQRLDLELQTNPLRSSRQQWSRRAERSTGWQAEIARRCIYLLSELERPGVRLICSKGILVRTHAWLTRAASQGDPAHPASHTTRIDTEISATGEVRVLEADGRLLLPGMIVKVHFP